MSSLRVATKLSISEFTKGSLSFASSGGSRKRKLGAPKEPSNDHRNSHSTILLNFVASETPDETVLKALSHNATPLVSSCSSDSCEQSLSSSSHYSAQAISEEFAEPFMTPVLVERHHHGTRGLRGSTKEKGKIDGHTDFSVAFPSASRRLHSKVRAVLFASSKDLDSNAWDDSSWNSSVSSCFPDGRKKGTATTHTITPTIPCALCVLPRGRKVESAVYATSPNNLHSKEPIWEDTNWSLRKKQKTLGNLLNGTENDVFEEIYQRNEKIIEGCRVPRNTDSVEWKLWKRLHQRDDTEQQFYLPWIPITPKRKATLSTSQSRGNHRSSSSDSPYALYRWLRMRLAAGLVRSSFDFLHRMLEKYYKEAEEVIRKLEQDITQEDELASLFNLRDRLADIWCVYAHFSLEVGCFALAREREKQKSSQQKEHDTGPNESAKTDLSVADSGNEIEPTSCYQEVAHQEVENKNIPNEQNEIVFDDIYNHAVSILLKARDCPLVGSHTAIGVSLARLIVSATAMEYQESDHFLVEVSREVLLSNIRSAIDVSWDNIDICRSKSHTNRRFTTKNVSKKTIRVLSNFEVKSQKLQEEKGIVKAAVEEGIESTLLLPIDLRNSVSSTIWSSEAVSSRDKDAISCLCVELNRLSRLEEMLEVNSHRAGRIVPSCDSELSFAAEELPLLAAVKSLSDPLNLYEEVNTLGKGVSWHW